MRLLVELGSYQDAVGACRTGNYVAAMVTESLADDLLGYAGMAGDDATSAQFAQSYDDAAALALATLAELTDAFTGLGRLLAGSADNHGRAEAASAGIADPSHAASADDFRQVRPARPPSSLGAQEPHLGVVDRWILDHVEGFVWPGADVDRLLDAAARWRAAAESVRELAADCESARDSLQHQVSPEVPLALDALARMRRLIEDASDVLTDVAASCEEYAEAVRAAHDRTRDLLAEIGQMIVEGVAISALVGFFSGGVGAGAAGGAALARIAAQAPRFRALLSTLSAVSASAATRLRSAREGLVAVRARAERFAKVARDERGSIRLPGPGARARARPTPTVSDQKLKHYVDHLFKGTQNARRVGDGTTMDAIRAELATGELTHGKLHTTKGREILRGLERWLYRNPGASDHDRQVAQALANELKDVLKL